MLEEGRDDAIDHREVEEAGKERALVDRGGGGERQSRRHAGGEELRRSRAGRERAAQERQERERDRQAFRDAQRIVGTKLGDVGPLGRARQREAARHAQDAADQRQRQRRAGQAGEPEVAVPRRAAQRQHGKGDEHDEVQLLDEAPSRPGREIERRQRRRHDDEPRARPAPQHDGVKPETGGEQPGRQRIAGHRQSHERERASRHGAAREPRTARRRLPQAGG